MAAGGGASMAPSSSAAGRPSLVPHKAAAAALSQEAAAARPVRWTTPAEAAMSSVWRSALPIGDHKAGSEGFAPRPS